MRAWWQAVAAVVWKDMVLEMRTKDMVTAVLFFSLLVLVIFNFALSPTPQMVAVVAPGVLWVAFVFGGVLGLTRSFAVERERGNLRALLLAPVGRDAIFFGKMLAILLLMLLVELIVFPVFTVMFNLSAALPLMIPVALLATLGIATIGTVFSAMAANTRAQEVMLPLLFLPVAVPTLIAAVEASGLVIRDGAAGDLGKWLQFLAVFDVIFLVVCPVAFSQVVED